MIQEDKLTSSTNSLGIQGGSVLPTKPKIADLWRNALKLVDLINVAFNKGRSLAYRVLCKMQVHSFQAMHNRWLAFEGQEKQLVTFNETPN